MVDFEKNRYITELYFARKLSAAPLSLFANADCVELYEKRLKVYIGVFCEFDKSRRLEEMGIFAEQAEEEPNRMDQPLIKYTIAAAWAAYPMRPIKTETGLTYVADMDCDNSNSTIARPIDRCYAVLALKSSGGFYYAKFITGRYKSSAPVIDKVSILKIFDSVTRL